MGNLSGELLPVFVLPIQLFHDLALDSAQHDVVLLISAFPYTPPKKIHNAQSQIV